MGVNGSTFVIGVEESFSIEASKAGQTLSSCHGQAAGEGNGVAFSRKGALPHVLLLLLPGLINQIKTE
jgi:hypothetical protein